MNGGAACCDISSSPPSMSSWNPRRTKVRWGFCFALHDRRFGLSRATSGNLADFHAQVDPLGHQAQRSHGSMNSPSTYTSPRWVGVMLIILKGKANGIYSDKEKDEIQVVLTSPLSVNYSRVVYTSLAIHRASLYK